eukprot:6583715-Prymnesium_polylepis.1
MHRRRRRRPRGARCIAQRRPPSRPVRGAQHTPCGRACVRAGRGYTSGPRHPARAHPTGYAA